MHPRRLCVALPVLRWRACTPSGLGSECSGVRAPRREYEVHGAKGPTDFEAAAPSKLTSRVPGSQRACDETPRRQDAGASTDSERPGSTFLIAAGLTAIQGIDTMSRKLFNTTLAALCTAALLFAVAVGVEAQSEEPLFEEDLVCSIQIGTELWIVPAVMQPVLENHLGLAAIVEPMAALLLRMPAATPSSSVRFEGGYPGGTVAAHLDSLGYRLEVQSTPELLGTLTAVTRLP